MNNSRIPTSVPIPSDIELEVDFSDDVPAAELVGESTTFTVSSGKKSVTIDKSKVTNAGGNTWVIPVETKELAPGDLWLTVTLKVANTSFSDGTKDTILREFTNIKLI